MAPLLLRARPSTTASGGPGCGAHLRNLPQRNQVGGCIGAFEGFGEEWSFDGVTVVAFRLVSVYEHATCPHAAAGMLIAEPTYMKPMSIALCLFMALSVAFGASAAKALPVDARASESKVTVGTQVSEPAPRGASLGSTADQRRYASREAASPEAKDYKGGDVVVIGATTLAVILLVVLIIILI